MLETTSYRRIPWRQNWLSNPMTRFIHPSTGRLPRVLKVRKSDSCLQTPVLAPLLPKAASKIVFLGGIPARLPCSSGASRRCRHRSHELLSVDVLWMRRATMWPSLPTWPIEEWSSVSWSQKAKAIEDVCPTSMQMMIVHQFVRPENQSFVTIAGLLRS